MRKLLFILGINSFLQINVRSQNLLINGDFEKGKSPACMGDAKNDYLDGWWSNSKVVNEPGAGAVYDENAVHSPDLFEEGASFLGCEHAPLRGGRPLPNGGPQSGSRCIGMTTYELVQTELTSVTAGKIYNVSMYIQLGNDPFGLHDNTKLVISLARQKVDYVDNGAFSYRHMCEPDYVNYNNPTLGMQEIITLKEFNLDPSLYYSTTTLWKRINFSFRWEEDYDSPLTNIMKWLVFEVRQKSYSDPGGASTSCYEDYLYIDNVVVQEATFCKSPCSPSLGDIEYSYKADYSIPNTFANALVANGFPWVFYVKNAIGIDFNVIDRDGHIIYNQKAFDPNGLADRADGFTDYQFFWNGDVPFPSNPAYPNFGGNFSSSFLLPMDVYAYRIKIWNCDLGDFVDHEATFTHICCFDDNTMVADINNYDLNDCCEPNAYFQNITWNTDFRKDVSDFITAGSSVTGGPTGPVVVDAGAHVQFFADNAINLMPGFSVNPGGDFEATLQNCLYSPRLMTTIRRDNLNGINISSESNYRTTFYPVTNLQNNFIFGTLMNSSEFIFNITFFSIDGKVVLNKSQVIDGDIFDLNNLISGVYLVRINDGKTYETHKIIITH